MTQPYHGAYTAFTTFLQYIIGGHDNINSTDIGEVDDFAISGEDQYPRAFIELPLYSQFDTSTVNWRCAIIFMDQEASGRLQEQQRLSNMWDIATDCVEAFKQPSLVTTAYTDNQFFLQNEYDLVTITQYGDDACCGVRFEFSMNQAIPTDRCDLNDIFTKIT